MNISSFINGGKCKHLPELDAKKLTENTGFLFAGVIRRAIANYAEGVPTEKIIQGLPEFLDQILPDDQKEITIEAYTKSLKRFLEYLDAQAYDQICPVSSFDAASVLILNDDGEDEEEVEIREAASFIAWKDGKEIVYRVRNKNHDNLSMSPKSTANRADGCAETLFFQLTHPGCEVRYYYMFRSKPKVSKSDRIDAEKGIFYSEGIGASISSSIVVKDDASSNLHIVPPSTLPEEDISLNLSLRLSEDYAKAKAEKQYCLKCRYCDCCPERVTSISKEYVKVNTYEEVETDYNLPKFDPEQQTAVDRMGVAKNLVVSCGAGAGKTAMLLGGMMKVKNQPGKKLVIAFSRAAAKEIESRARSLGCDEKFQISTIHSAAYQILYDNKGRLGYEPHILTKITMAKIVTFVLDNLGFTIRGINYTKGKAYAVKDFIDCYELYQSDQLKEERGGRIIDMDAFEKAVETLEGELKRRGFITETQLISTCCEFLENNKLARMTKARETTYVFVDEAQDIDEDQYRLICMLSSHGKLIMLGDDAQSIYDWRGGSPKFMIATAASEDGELICCNNNYRSVKPICELSEGIANSITDGFKKNVKSVKDGGSISYHSIPAGKSTLFCVENAIASLKNKGTSYDDIAVLCRDNSTADMLYRQLHQHGVPALLGRSLVISDPLFVLFLTSAEFIKSKGTDRKAFLTIREMMQKVPNEDKDYETLIYENKSLYDIYNDNPTIPDQARSDAYVQITSYLRHFRILMEKGMSTKDTVLTFLKMLGLNENILFYLWLDDYVTRNESNAANDLDVFLLMARNMIIFEAEDALRPSKSDAVQILTIHSAKGLEWKNVLIAGLEAIGYEKAKENEADKNRNENLRLLYVAVTRAKENLMVFQSDGKTAKSYSYNFTQFFDRYKVIDFAV